MAVIFFALFLRTYELDNRPLHVDEAVHAVKFGELLENGFYKYDPIEYHGPTLNYLTLVSSTIFGIHSFAELTEYTIRIVPAIISVLFIIFAIFMFPREEKHLKYLIIILLSISPILLFYSRYYIQEVLLVSFSYSLIIICYKYFQSKKTSFAIVAGILTGLIFATKETSIITFSSGITSILILYLFDNDIRKKIIISTNHVILFISTAIFISILFYSSFFSNYDGIYDSLKTFSNYFSKASENGDHIQSWYYYIELLVYSNNEKIIFSEIFLLLFALIGIYFSLFSKQENQTIIIFRFLSFFSFIQIVIYSLIPYKTPWLALNFWVGLLLLSAFGITKTYSLFAKRISKQIYSGVVIIFLIHNLWQTYEINYKYPFQPENPFTYSQATCDVVSLTKHITDVLEAVPDKENILISVIVPENDYWPLPWYFRKFKKVAWNNKIQNSIYKFPIIISKPVYEDEIINKLYTIPPPGRKNLYVPLFDKYLELRPGVELRGYIQKDVIDIYNRTNLKP